MKKLFFSVLTLVTFTVNANNIEIKDEDSSQFISETPCADAYAEDLENLKSLGMSFLEAHDLASVWFEECIENTYH